DIFKRDIAYAKGWDALTLRRRDLANRLAIKRDPKEQAIYDKLEEPVSLNIDKQPLSEAIDFLRQYTGLNIVPDQKALLEEGLTMNTPVSLTIKDVKLKNALKLLLAPLNLTYKADGEVLMLTSPTASR